MSQFLSLDENSVYSAGELTSGCWKQLQFHNELITILGMRRTSGTAAVAEV